MAVASLSREGAAGPGSARDFRDRQSLGRENDDLRALYMVERTISIADDGEQTLATFGRDNDADCLGQTARFTHLAQRVSPMSASLS